MQREVTVKASRFAQENDMLFMETSAKTGDNVMSAFLQSTRCILERIGAGELSME